VSSSAMTPNDSFRVHHFQDANTQAHAARLGMWLFLGTEVLLFAGLFVAYSIYRGTYHTEFKLASEHLNGFLGLVNTINLITSSLTMALAIWAAEKGRKQLTVLLLVVTILCGLIFLVIHGYEYHHEWTQGALPGKYYHYKALPFVGSNMFYTLYFLMTGLHSLHVFIGMSVITVLVWRTLAGDYHAAYVTPLELGGMYWHLVDLIWIFLFPLLYLI
jgi:cytochrome c oxidase subunit 3